MLLKGESEGSELFVPSQKCESVGDAVVGGSSDSELSKQSLVLIIYTKCCYHPKWSRFDDRSACKILRLPLLTLSQMLDIYYFKSLSVFVFSFLLLKCDRPVSEL